jgi:hypothetical protein
MILWLQNPADHILDNRRRANLQTYKKNFLARFRERTKPTERPSDRRLSATLMLIFADGGCHVVSVTDPNGLILGFLDRSR